jgi:hypothetical protein
MGVLRTAAGLLLLASLAAGRGDFEDFEAKEAAEVTANRAKAYYTEVMVQSALLPQDQACAKRVLDHRRAATADGKKVSLGVEPTVSLGAALCVFLGVGVFAICIAQAFQMVSVCCVPGHFFVTTFPWHTKELFIDDGPDICHH